jgi:glutathione S-transferase
MAARDVVLRYFDCRSRGQALRFALVDGGVAFEDERIPVEELPAFRERVATEPGHGGPFGSLPVLSWRGQEVAQTLAVASFLAAELDLDGGSDIADFVRGGGVPYPVTASPSERTLRDRLLDR